MAGRRHPGLSVIVPAHDSGHTVVRAVRSALEHSDGHDVEVIVVDDASRDETATAVHRVFAADPRVRVIRHPNNRGAGVARMTGLAVAKGDFLAFLDADDYFLPTLSEVLRRAVSSAADVVLFDYEVYGHDGGRQRGRLAGDDIVWSLLESSTGQVHDISEIPEALRLAAYPWNRLLSRTFAEGVGLRFSATPVLNDVHAHWQTLLRARRIVVDETVAVRHIWDLDGKQLTNSAGPRRIASLVVLDEVGEIFANDGSLRSYRPYFESFRLDLLSWVYRQASQAERALLQRGHGPLVPRVPLGFEPDGDPNAGIVSSARARRILLLGFGRPTLRHLETLRRHFDVVGLLDWNLADAGRRIDGLYVFHPAQQLPSHDVVVVCESLGASRDHAELAVHSLRPVDIESLLPGAALLHRP